MTAKRAHTGWQCNRMRVCNSSAILLCQLLLFFNCWHVLLFAGASSKASLPDGCNATRQLGLASLFQLASLHCNTLGRSSQPTITTQHLAAQHTLTILEKQKHSTINQRLATSMQLQLQLVESDKFQAAMIQMRSELICTSAAADVAAAAHWLQHSSSHGDSRPAVRIERIERR